MHQFINRFLIIFLPSFTYHRNKAFKQSKSFNKKLLFFMDYLKALIFRCIIFISKFHTFCTYIHKFCIFYELILFYCVFLAHDVLPMAQPAAKFFIFWYRDRVFWIFLNFNHFQGGLKLSSSKSGIIDFIHRVSRWP